MREGGRKKKEKGREMRWGWLRFFFRGDDNISYFPSQEGEKRGKANSFFTFECYDSNNKRRESRQGKARGTRRKREGGKRTRPDRSRKHHLAKGNGTERYHRKARQGKGKGNLGKGKLY